MMVSFGSIRGAPGVTSWAALVASRWPDPDNLGRVLLEADPAGGVLGSRYGFGVEPGVVSLVTGLRRTAGEIDVTPHARATASGVLVVPGPASGEDARAVWASVADGVADRLRRDSRVWIVDVGRVDVSSPVVALCAASSMTVIVVGPSTEDLVQLPARVAFLQSRGCRVGILVVGKCAYSGGDIAAHAGVEMVWMVAGDRDIIRIAATALEDRKRVGSLWPVQQATTLAAGLFHDALSELEVRDATG
jgi:MinD-like ATPase involved in chromosome partitioning or flagellar assembly